MLVFVSTVEAVNFYFDLGPHPSFSPNSFHVYDVAFSDLNF